MMSLTAPETVASAGGTRVLSYAVRALSYISLTVLLLYAGTIVNVVVGPGRVCGQRLVEHPDVAKIAFTGSTEVGRYFLQYSAQSNLKQVVLELGGKSPQIVTASMSGELSRPTTWAPVCAIWAVSWPVPQPRSRILWPG